jgi:hypothetical protein
MSGPWSKLKSRVEALWAPRLGLAIHCTSYVLGRSHDHNKLSRHWFLLDGRIIWDFPGPFLDEDCKRGGPAPGASRSFPNGRDVISHLLRDYLDRDRDRLFEPFEGDDWELTDILRAADRRLGKAALTAWAAKLDGEHPAHPVLDRRFSC